MTSRSSRSPPMGGEPESRCARCSPPGRCATRRSRSTTPSRKPLWPEARNSTALATSSGQPGRPSGRALPRYRTSPSAETASDAKPRSPSTSIGPGTNSPSPFRRPIYPGDQGYLVSSRPVIFSCLKVSYLRGKQDFGPQPTVFHVAVGLRGVRQRGDGL